SPRPMGCRARQGTATMPWKRCPGIAPHRCARLIPTSARHCAEHEVQWTRNKREQRPYTNQEKDRRAAAVAEHRAVHGNWCPGWGDRPAHTLPPWGVLGGDHDEAVGAGGREDGPLTVRCRECNSAKGTR